MRVIEESFSEETEGFEGGCLAYETNPAKEPNLINYLQDQGVEKDIIEAIKKINEDILLVKNMYIDEEYRGNGFGSIVFEEMLNESTTGKVILISDNEEDQRPGFNLNDFYTEYGFEKANKQSSPLMMSEDLMEEFKLKIKRKRNVTNRKI